MIVKAKGKPKPIPDEKPNRARTRLIEVAARHFAEHGIQGASQRAIQREVGVNPATAHYYFGSKEALYRAVKRHWSKFRPSGLRGWNRSPIS
jgi:AcrR family transcriptional regulator